MAARKILANPLLQAAVLFGLAGWFGPIGPLLGGVCGVSRTVEVEVGHAGQTMIGSEGSYPALLGVSGHLKAALPLS